MKNTVSRYSMPLETKYHHRAPATCLRQKHENGFEGKRRQAQAEEGNAKKKKKTKKQFETWRSCSFFLSLLFYNIFNPRGYLRPTRLRHMCNYVMEQREGR